MLRELLVQYNPRVFIIQWLESQINKEFKSQHIIKRVGKSWQNYCQVAA